jgi:predicted RecB family nuclease
MDKNKLRPQTLDHPFDFSQASLQDYTDCPRRFQLRYIEQLRWPAPQAEPLRENEAHIRRGDRFHRLAQQALAGIPPERLAAVAAADPDPALKRWWENFTLLLPALQEGSARAEVMLAAPLTLTPSQGGHRLLAKYDLIQFLPGGQVVIYDWKTHLFRPRRSSLQSRLQTLVYPALLARAGTSLNDGQPLSAGQIEMVYWFAEFPDQPERFTFTPLGLEQNWEIINQMVAEIAALPAAGFPLTREEKRCRFCVYRSLCARGVQAGLLAESDEDPDDLLSLEGNEAIDIDFEQIGEISF